MSLNASRGSANGLGAHTAPDNAPSDQCTPAAMTRVGPDKSRASPTCPHFLRIKLVSFLVRWRFTRGVAQRVARPRVSQSPHQLTIGARTITKLSISRGNL